MNLLIAWTVSIVVVSTNHYFPSFYSVWGIGAINQLFFSAIAAFILTPLFFLSSPKLINGVVFSVFSILIIFEMISSFYFSITLQPLDKILFEFDLSQAEMIAGDFVVFEWYYLLLFLIPLTYWFIFRITGLKKITTPALWIGSISVVLSVIFGLQVNTDRYLHSKLSQNKTFYFLSSFWDSENANYISLESSILSYQKNENKSFSSIKYPLLQEPSKENSLQPFFYLNDEKPPNIVFIIVESLSSSFSGQNANEISYTPFLDSLSDHSIYFENALSTGERTFSVLPSVLGSLPHGRKGFTHEKHGYPKSNSLLTWLVKNGYHSSFNYGGHARFDYMDLFLKEHDLHEVYDRIEYNYEGTSLKTSFDPVPFGISDLQLMREVYGRQKNHQHAPFLDIILTLSSHYPFVIEDQEKYIQEVKNILKLSEANDSVKRKHSKYEKEFSTLLYVDDVLRKYFIQRKSEKDHDNTIYIILGDHMMTDIPHQSNLEKYRSPLMIYSPLIKRSKRIKAVNSHLDIAPSIYQLIKEKYSFEDLKHIHWLGAPFDTTESFQSKRTLLFMRNERKYKDFLNKDQFISEGESYQIDSNLNISKSKTNKHSQLLFNAYKNIHLQTVQKNRIIPESEGKILSQRESIELKITENNEFSNILAEKLNYDIKSLGLHMNISLGQGWKKSDTFPDESQPLLIVALKREGENYFWKRIDLELDKKPIEKIRRIHLNIKNNLEFEMKKGDELNVYFWNNSKGKNPFFTTLYNIEVHGNE